MTANLQDSNPSFTKSQLWFGHVMHARLGPRSHAFQYPVYFYRLELDELMHLHERIPFFSYNRKNVTALHDHDYLRGSGSIREKVLRELHGKPYEHEVTRIELVTCLRYFNYAFNPVSFYACRNDQEKLLCVIAEVNNTFGERHIYVLDQPNIVDGWAHYVSPKQFHVSPFNSVDGEYRFRFPIDWAQKPLRIGVELWQEGKRHFTSEWFGKEAKPFTANQLAQAFLKFPFSALLTMPRILWQAARLYFEKRLRVFMKPEPTHQNTFRATAPTWRVRMAMKLVLGYFRRFQIGKLIVQLPDGSEEYFGDVHSDRAIRLTIRNDHFFLRVLSASDVGFGESYMAGEWDTSDLTGLLRLIVDNRPYVDDNKMKSLGILKWISSLRHAFNANSLRGSRENIRAHYDLSNAMYQTFLDPTMTYSSAYFKESNENLEQAQLNKLDRMIKLAQLQPSDHVLEIGSGWGSFAMRAAKTIGCKVTTITLSEQQLVEARARIQAAGLADLVEVKFCDYREMTGQFDKLVSIEMFEAVGHKYYGTFFAACDRLLKPNGLLAMQVITIEDQRYETYRKESDWIQKYIFPGGLCPSITAFSEALTNHSQFVIEQFDNIGIHYAKTLKMWREQFEANREHVLALGFDETFLRMWRYYLAYCEAGFRARTLGTLQILMTRPNNSTLPDCP